MRIRGTEPEGLFAKEQYRFSLLQVYNWGTFHGYSRMPISGKGFLIIGKSGSGKSTLLDAFSALLVPPSGLDFNAAARESERSGRDRTFVSYVRGAWAEQKDDESGLYATRYLRPGPTWSAVALTLKNDSGRTVTLMQICWIRGNSNNAADLHRYYLVLEQELDLRELSGIIGDYFEIRKVKAAFPDAFGRDEFGPYAERFRMLLGIESDKALRLLHKTQSAKNLGDLNTFLREFMLDRPGTFDAADQLVKEFGELSAAHQAVVTARDQVEVLGPSRELHRNLLEKRAKIAFLRETSRHVDAFTDLLKNELLGKRIGALEAELAVQKGETGLAKAAYERMRETVRELERRRSELGGDRITFWESDIETQKTIRDQRMRRRTAFESSCRSMDWQFPSNPREFGIIREKASEVLRDSDAASSARRTKLIRISSELEEAGKQLKLVMREVEMLRKHPSNIPADYQEMRGQIAAAIGVSETSLPFAGELLQVKPDEQQWAGAIERVLHGFALSLLVEEKHYPALSEYVNGNHLGKRLVYLRMLRQEKTSFRQAKPDSLIFKLDKKESPFAEWMEVELLNRFDYRCVEDLSAFRSAERAVTREGQVKHGPSRHEKDDRNQVGQKRDWVLGFDSREKFALYLAEEAEWKGKTRSQAAALDTLEKEDREWSKKIGECGTIAATEWMEIDPLPVIEKIASLELLIREARAEDTDFAKAERELIDKKLAENGLLTRFNAATRHEEKTSEHLEKLREDLVRVGKNIQESAALPAAFAGELETRFRNFAADLDLESLPVRVREVDKRLTGEVESIDAECAELRSRIEMTFAEFRRRWEAESADLDGSIDSAPDFFAKLSRLESDNLPAFEGRFFSLMENQSHQNLAALSHHLNGERKNILERMDLVNRSLAEVPFNRGPQGDSILKIETVDRQTAEVKEFRQEVQAALSFAWNADRETAEARFRIIDGLVKKLESRDPEHRRWRDAVLDVRLHVEFIGREFDGGGAEIEVYRGGAGKSGGQRQKLTATCLAAALRYQLGGSDHGLPVYAPVVLDEAFDKADNDFTALAMKIFENFGFQMIVATPMKSVMTLEPFVGGVAFIDIKDRKQSCILPIDIRNDLNELLSRSIGENEE